jgi:hypothetical protein
MTPVPKWPTCKFKKVFLALNILKMWLSLFCPGRTLHVYPFWVWSPVTQRGIDNNTHQRRTCILWLLNLLGIDTEDKSRVVKVHAHPGSNSFSLVFKCSPSMILKALRHPVTPLSGVTCVVFHQRRHTEGSKCCARAAGARTICVGFADVTRICHANVTRICHANVARHSGLARSIFVKE